VTAVLIALWCGCVVGFLAGSALGTYRAMRHTARVLDLIDDPISRDHIAKAFEVAR
jgi:uncharacterized protein YneF (UPF0154 family)